MGNRLSRKNKKQEKQEEKKDEEHKENEEIEELRIQVNILQKRMEKNEEKTERNYNDMREYYHKINTKLIEMHNDLYSNLSEIKVDLTNMKDYQKEITGEHNSQIMLLNEVIEKYDTLKQDLNDHASNFSIFGYKLN